MQRATQIAVVHNHPSGNIQPSQPDRTLTEHIRKAADTMNIRLVDHVILSYRSAQDRIHSPGFPDRTQFLAWLQSFLLFQTFPYVLIYVLQRL